jgi:hypothetical protein
MAARRHDGQKGIFGLRLFPWKLWNTEFAHGAPAEV